MNNQITVLVERCTMQINLDPFFTQATLAKQKKLLGYVFQEPWRNEETIRILDAYLPQKQAQAKDAWENASKRYQNEYTGTQFRYDLTANQKRTIEAANRKMLNEVKRCKAKYERWGKIIAYYEMLKTKNHF
jgi:hypothetical protein